MEKIGYDVVSVGERDLAGGVPAFMDLVKERSLSLTSASFAYRDNGAPLFAPYVIREYDLPSKRKLKIGYMGLNGLNSAFAKEARDGRVVIMRDPVEVARATLPPLRQRVDFVVLLANMSLRELHQILSAVPGIDLVFASHGSRLTPSGGLEAIGEVPVMYAGDQGKRLGEVRLYLMKGKDRPHLSGHQIVLTKRYPSEPHLQALIDRTIVRVNELNRARAERLASIVPTAVPAGGVAPSAPASAIPSIDGAIRPFATANACAHCHADAYDIYMKSAHAHALDTLTKVSQDFNAECVKCHVTGFGTAGGFINARQTPDLANVQCEACHGNASGHIADPGKPFGSVPPRTCFACHTKENSPDFVFFKYWHAIAH